MTSSKFSEIKILGSGPSGLTAAINLARNDHKVTIFERKGKPGAHFVNGWQILENYSSKINALSDLKTMSVEPSFFFKAETSIEFYDSLLRKFHLTGKKPYGYYLKRGPGEDTLDTALYNQAINAGVNFQFNTRIDPANADIISGGSTYASGVAKEITFESDSKDVFRTIIDHRLTPLGFSYLFVIDGQGTIGAAIMRDFNNIDNLTRNVVLRFQQLGKFSMKNQKISVSSVGFFLPNTAKTNGSMYIGEAAGFQDFLFGLGIRRSIQSGYLAAQSIITGENYDDLWKKQFKNQLVSGILNRFLFEISGDTGCSLLLWLAQKADFQKAGYFLHNPAIGRRLLAYFVKSFWGRRSRCKHGSRCSWCRSL